MVRTRFTSLAVGAALSLSLVACGDDGGGDMMDSGMPDAMPDTSMPDTSAPDTSVPDTSMPDAMPDGSTGDSFDTAVPITVQEAMEPPVTDAIEAPGDSDFYTFEGTEGQWMGIFTSGNEDDDPMMVDTVITLYDSTRTRIAENDDAQPRTTTNSELLTRLPSTGTYYIEVQEFSAWSGGDPEGQPDFEYGLSLVQIEAGAALVTVDAERGDDAGTAPTFAWTPDPAAQFIFGTYRDDTDVDVLRFAVTGGRRSFSLDIMPQGDQGYGSTVDTGDVWITSLDEPTVIIARVDGSGDRALNPTLAEGNYLLWVDHPGGAGSNDFYALKANLGTENTNEAEVVGESTNDTLATAEALTLMDDGTGTSTGFVLSTLTDGDVDYRSFDVAADQEVTIVCASLRGGSGVVGLTASLHDSTDTLRPGATGVETAMDNVRIVETTPPAGTYYLRLEKTGQDATVTGSWARCGLFVGAPAPAP